MTISASVPHEAPHQEDNTTFGHPSGLFTLFFAEMWERFSYYGMRALLVFYMIKGFLGYGDKVAYGVYGAYTALVYASPFIGGMVADKILGARRSVVLGGLLMAAGHLLMTIEQTWAFYGALGLLICGNGFFKPNISTMVGSLYKEGSHKRDGGFTIFYMGINLGAAMSPLLCGYIGETYGWHYGFGLATIGMLVGLAVFVAPTRLTQALIGLTAVSSALGMVWIGAQNTIFITLTNGAVALFLVASAFAALRALSNGGLPSWAGAPKHPERAAAPMVLGLSGANAVYLGTLIAIPLVALLLSPSVMLNLGGVEIPVSRILLIVAGGAALVSLFITAVRSPKIERERLYVVFVLMFFVMLFWAFFEQGGSSLNNFTDRNIQRVVGGQALTQADVGTTLKNVQITQNFIGFELPVGPNGTDKIVRLNDVDDATQKGDAGKLAELKVTEKLVGLTVEGSEIKASVYQAANPIFILVFGLVLTWLWAFLDKRGLDPSTAAKFGLGLLQLGLGFVLLWWGASNADARGMVPQSYLLIAYLLYTTGELCLSPVGLSMITKLAPKEIASTLMGAWFLATAFSNDLAGFIAQLTSVGHEGGAEKDIPLPKDTVHVYGEVFLWVGVAACISALVVFLLSGILTKWMHNEELEAASGGH